MQWPVDLRDPAYASGVLDAVSRGAFDHAFVPLTIDVGSHRGTFGVSQDALKIDGIRINASATLLQEIADILDAFLLTPKLLDQMWAQRAITLAPCPQPINATSAGMIKHSACVDDQIAKAGGIPPNGIVETVGKTWVLSNKLTPTVAMNMGWYLEQPLPGIPFDPAPTLPGAHMIQAPGTHHDAAHIDYSQVCLFVQRGCLVDDEPSDFATVAQSPTLSALVSGSGPLRTVRQPGVPELVRPPEKLASVPAGGTTVALAALGAGIGTVVAGPPGALVGGVSGWALDAIRRRLIV
jgi:hypothetical protein